MTDSSASVALALNRNCDCTLTDVAALAARIDAECSDSDPVTSIIDTHPHLFSEAPVFLETADAQAMERIVRAVHEVVRLPDYRRATLPAAPMIAHAERAAEGVFLGFDFHISADGPRLIEINTNAGGAMLNIAARGAQRACCASVAELLGSQTSAAALEQQVVDMFLREWRLARGERPLRSIAIVDDEPARQYLFPEFALIRRSFESRGIEASIVDAGELEIRGANATSRGRPIDLIYNRLTDFYFTETRHSAIREAYLRDLAVITPHPRAHALYSSKRNLAVLSDAASLHGVGASRSCIDALSRGIPRTLEVNGDKARWWAERKQWFFKPTDGFGSRGVYRGDKITRRAFDDVMNGKYIAQLLTPPSERFRNSVAGGRAFKIDIRCYSYAGKIQLTAARLYQGQATNFRTDGGGFAPVYVLPAKAGLLDGLVQPRRSRIESINVPVGAVHSCRKFDQ